ncbi:MAG TPA: TetR/AcrR family transcriptional regulator [Acidimicrobiales bacterium]|nr:TetR/AcrR family transcriptional regulator [Acidimicrobiales bacterium]
MTDDRASTVGLRREPVQRRSRERVDAILAAATELLAEVEGTEITTTTIAARAGVPVGSLYEYFVDREAVIDAVAARMLDRHDEHLRAALTAAPESLEAMVDALYAAYADFYRAEPAFISLRLSSLYTREHRSWVVERIDHLLADVVKVGADAGVLPDDPGLVDRLQLVWAVGDAVLQVGYRSDPRGDPAVIAEGREIVLVALARAARAG